MIKVEVREQDVTDAFLLAQVQRRADGPRVHHHRVIDQESTGAALLRSAPLLQELIGTMAAQDPDLHGNSFWVGGVFVGDASASLRTGPNGSYRIGLRRIPFLSPQIKDLWALSHGNC